MKATDVVTAMRIALIILCGEGAASYWFFWLRLRRADAEYGLGLCFLSLALYNSALFFFASIAFLPPWSRLYALMVGDPVIIAAAVAGLVPCWLIGREYAPPKVRRAAMTRAAIVIALILGMVALGFDGWR